MSHSLTQIRNLLRQPGRAIGVVQRVEGSTVYVSTPRGIVMATASSTAGLSAGASVALDGTTIVSVKSAEPDLPLFSV